jgi:hypothetical protein
MADTLEHEVKQLYREHTISGGERHEAFDAAVALYCRRTGLARHEAQQQVERIVTDMQHDPRSWAEDEPDA